MTGIEDATGRGRGLAGSRITHENYIQPRVGEGQRRAETCNTGTDDGNVGVRCGHARMVVNGMREAYSLAETPDRDAPYTDQNFPEGNIMLKVIFTIGVVTLLGLFALKLIGVLFFPLIGLAVKILLIGAVVYGVMLVVAPGAARRLRDKVNSPRSY